MPHDLNVQVLGSSGNPVRNAKVEMTIMRVLSKGGRIGAYTDEDGHAYFTTANDYEDSRELYIRVRGQEFGPYKIGGGSYTVQL